jgi:hypothetical protein
LIDHFVASSFRHFTHFIHSWFATWGDTLDEKRFQIPHNRRKDLTPASSDVKPGLEMIQSDLKLIL